MIALGLGGQAMGQVATEGSPTRKVERPSEPAPVQSEERPGAPATMPDYSDCPSLVIDLIAQDQVLLADLPNRWRTYWDLVARYAGMSQFAVWGVPALRALQRDDRSDNAEQVLREITKSSQEPDPALVGPARGFLRDLANTGFFNELDLLTAPARFVPDRSSEPLLHSEQPQLGHSRELGRLLAIQMRLAAADRDQWPFWRAGRQGLALARGAAYAGGVSAHLAAVAVQADVLREVRWALQKGRLEPGACRELIAAMNDLEMPNATLAIRCERLHALEVIAGMYDKVEGRFGAPEAPNAPPEAPKESDPKTAAGNGVGDAQPVDMQAFVPKSTRAEAVALMDRFFEAWLESLSPSPEVRRTAEALLADIRRRVTEPGDPVAESPVSFSVFNVPAVDGVITHAAAVRAGTLVMLAIELYRAERGELPATLDQLVPEFLTQVPLDPCMSGTAIRYRRGEKPAEGDASGYLLYSVGADGMDDGGKICPLGNRESLSAERGAGFDFILNVAE